MNHASLDKSPRLQRVYNALLTGPKTTFKGKDLTGTKFSRWTVVALVEVSTHLMPSLWLCRCECGTEKILPANSFRYGGSKSCGCLSREITSKRFFKHGHSGKNSSKVYNTWSHMINRCYNPKASDYKFYGARGITVSDPWRNFSNFLADMGEPPEGLEIDRIDNNKGYFNGNCRWTTHKENCLNTRHNRILEFNGKKMTLKSWSEEINIAESSLRRRLKSWPIEKALTAPVNSTRSSGATMGNLKRYGV